MVARSFLQYLSVPSKLRSLASTCGPMEEYVILVTSHWVSLLVQQTLCLVLGWQEPMSRRQILFATRTVVCTKKVLEWLQTVLYATVHAMNQQ